MDSSQSRCAGHMISALRLVLGGKKKCIENITKKKKKKKKKKAEFPCCAEG